MTVRICGIALTLLAAAPAAAQQRAAPFLTAPAAPVLPSDTVPDTAAARRPMSQGGRVAVRTAAGGVGWIVGALAGGVSGVALEGESEKEWDALNDAFFGALLGAVVGGAAGAAIPEYHRGCGFGARFGRGLLGSLGGTALGLAFISAVDDGPVLVALPLSGGLIAAVAADC